MTTKIIRPGTDTYRATCTECGCQFTYQREDVVHSYLYVGDRVCCPQCGNAMYHFGASGIRWPDLSGRLKI